MAYFNEANTMKLLMDKYYEEFPEIDKVVHICKYNMNMVKIPVTYKTDAGFDLQIEFHLPPEEEKAKYYRGEIKSILIGSGHLYPENPTEEEMKLTQPNFEHRILCLNDIIRSTNRDLAQNQKFYGQVKYHFSNNRRDFNIYYEFGKDTM